MLNMKLYIAQYMKHKNEQTGLFVYCLFLMFLSFLLFVNVLKFLCWSSPGVPCLLEHSKNGRSHAAMMAGIVKLSFTERSCWTADSTNLEHDWCHDLSSKNKTPRREQEL